MIYKDNGDLLNGIKEAVSVSKEGVKITNEDLFRNKVIDELGNGIEAFNSVPTAIYSFLSQPHSFAQAVLHAISLGGDTDTIGAMTGAISGAYLGFDSIPGRWKNKFENRPCIEELAERLWRGCIGSW